MFQEKEIYTFRVKFVYESENIDRNAATPNGFLFGNLDRNEFDRIRPFNGVGYDSYAEAQNAAVEYINAAVIIEPKICHAFYAVDKKVSCSF